MFIPNSYDVYWNTTPEKFRKNVKGVSEVLNTSRLDKAKQIGLSPLSNNIGIYCSRRIKQTLEQPTIAGIFEQIKNPNAFTSRSNLEICSYHQENYNGKEIKRILNKHKSIESPYNTYKYIDYHQVQ